MEASPPNNQDQPASKQYTNSKGQYVGPDYWKRPKNRWLIYSAIILVLLIAGGAGYWFLVRSKPAAKITATQSSGQVVAKSKITATTKSYSSSNFNLNFNYPTDWTVTDGGNGEMTVRSSAMQLKSATGSNVPGQVVMTIASMGTNLGVFDKGNATAVLDSQKVAYTNPTQSQRANTYLSFLQYATTTASGALDGVYITGDFGYQKSQAIPKVDIANIDPLVTVTFVQCSTDACSGTTKALSIAGSAWTNTSFSAPITKMLESLAFD